MEELTVSHIVTLVAAILGSSFLTALITSIANRKIRIAEAETMEASAADHISTAYGKVIEALERRIEVLSIKLEDLEKDNKLLRDRICDLEKENKQLDIRTNELERYYTELTDALRGRVRLLAKLLGRVFRLKNGNISLDELINGFKITKEERKFLEEIIYDDGNEVHIDIKKPLSFKG